METTSMIILKHFENGITTYLKEEFVTFVKSIFMENEDSGKLDEPKTVQECIDYIQEFCDNFEIVYPFAISISDGHNEDWTFYNSKEEVEEAFEDFKKFESDIHVYEFSLEYGYEVIDSYWDEDED